MTDLMANLELRTHGELLDEIMMLRKVLTDLFAMVQGESPHLLEDHHLFDEISQVLAPVGGPS